MRAPEYISVAELVREVEKAIIDKRNRPLVKTWAHGVIEEEGKAGRFSAVGRLVDAAGMPGAPVMISASDWLRMSFPFASRDHAHDTFWFDPAGGGLAYVEIGVSVEQWLRYIEQQAQRQATFELLLTAPVPQTPKIGRLPDIKEAVRCWCQMLSPEDRARPARALARRYHDEQAAPELLGNFDYVRGIIGDLKRGKQRRRRSQKP